MILIQTISIIFYTVSTLVLKGYSAVVQNVVSLFRNLFSIRGNISKVLEWFLVAVGVVLGIYFNNLGLVGLLPVVANFEYTVAVFRFKNNVTALKIAFIINAVLFSVFNAYLLNFIGLIGNIVLVITTVISLIKQKDDPALNCETVQTEDEDKKE